MEDMKIKSCGEHILGLIKFDENSRVEASTYLACLIFLVSSHSPSTVSSLIINSRNSVHILLNCFIAFQSLY